MFSTVDLNFHRTIRRFALALACVALAAACAGGPARADESAWALTELHLGGEETIFGMSCQASGCIGVGQNGVAIASAVPTGGAAAWSISHVNVGEANLAGNLRGVSCPSTSLCVAVDHSGGVYTTTDPGAGGGSWRATKIPKAKQLFAVSCPSPGFCVLAGLEGVLVSSTDPTGGASAWTVTHLSEPLPLRSLSCPSAQLCVAGDAAGNVLASTEPAKASSWAVTPQPNGENPVLGMGCAGASLCVAGDAANALVSTAPGSAGSWVTTPLANRFQILAASCPTASLCVLSSNNGEVSVSTAPTAGSAAWATVHPIHGVTNALFGLSCAGEGLCVAGGKFGQLVFSTDPAATGLPAPQPPPPPPPPETRLLWPHRHLIRIGRRHATTVSFRFAGAGVATFFRCRIDGRPGALCGSPRRYRVGPGRHAFRVRAFGPGGGDPTPLVFRFRVVAAAKSPKP